MSRLSVKSIAIIGAGPAGLAAAKHFLAEKSFDKVVVFEQRSKVGGVWVHTPETTRDESFSIPQTSPRGRIDEPLWRTQVNGARSVSNGVNGHERRNGEAKEAVFVSPMYDSLETNIPHTLMQYSDAPFPEQTQLFPRHKTVLEYLEKYADDVRHVIQFETQITNVDLISTEPDQWELKIRDLRSETVQDHTFDAVVVANGHYNLPYIPDIDGLLDWDRAHPGSISHSKYFRRPDDYKGKKVIVVGNSASGIDIGAQIGIVCAPPIIISSKSVSYLTSATPLSEKLELPPIKSLDADSRAVTFASGHVESDVDHIVFCTGYFYSYPFLNKGIQSRVIEDGSRVAKTYKHLFYQDHPTLSFLALPQKVIPFPISEAQSAVLARAYSGRLPIPALEEMQVWESDMIAEHGDADQFHVLQFPEDADYINDLHDWAERADRRDGLQNDGRGKASPYWGEWARWCRPRFPEMRKAFGAQGERRQEIYTLEQIGFRYECEENGTI